MPNRIQLRRGNEADWTSTNPLLAEGEISVELDTGKFKIGNGVDYWNDLAYASGPAGPSGPVGPSGATGTSQLSLLTDVDVSQVTTGSILVYQVGINKWVSTTTLSQQIIDAGEF